MQRSFRYAIKQHGGMLAKGRLLGIQFAELLRGGNDCLYFRLAAHAVAMAARIKKSFKDRGIEMWNDSTTNMQFPILSKKQIEFLSQEFSFERWGVHDSEHDVVRFCTSWATREESVEKLCRAIESMPS
jgi:threonine aldolase